MLDRILPDRQKTVPAPCNLTRVNLFKLFIFNEAARNIDDEKIIYESEYYKNTCKSLGIPAHAYDCSKIEFTESFSSFERLEIFDFISSFDEQYRDKEALGPTCAIVSAFQLFLTQDTFALTNLIMPVLKKFFCNANIATDSSVDESLSYNSPIIEKLINVLEIKVSNPSRPFTPDEIDKIHEDVKKAYKKLALRHHPDRNKGNEESAANLFKPIGDVYTEWNNKILKSSSTTKFNRFKYAVDYFIPALLTQYNELTQIFGAELQKARNNEEQYTIINRQNRVSKTVSEIETTLLATKDEEIAALKEKHRSNLKEEKIKQLLRLILVYYRVGFIIKCLIDDKHKNMPVFTGVMALLPAIRTLYSYYHNNQVTHTSSNLLFDSALDTTNSLWLTGIGAFVYTLKYAQLSNFHPNFFNIILEFYRNGFTDTAYKVLIAFICSLSWPGADKALPLLIKTPLFAEIVTIGAYTAYTTLCYGWQNVDIEYFLVRGSDNECVVGSDKKTRDSLPFLRIIKTPERYTKPAFQITNALCSIAGASCVILEYNYRSNGFLSSNLSAVASYLTTNPITSLLTASFTSAIYFGPHKFFSYQYPRFADFIEASRNFCLPTLAFVILTYSHYLYYTIICRDSCNLFNLGALPLSAKIVGIGIITNTLLLGATHYLSNKPRTWGESIAALTGSGMLAEHITI